MKAIALAFCAIVLAGCANARIQAASAEMEKDKAACQSQKFASQMALARCINAAEQRAATNSGIGGRDLVAVRLTTRLAIAEKMDKGQMTQAEGELEFAKVNSNLTSTEQQRVNSAVTANAISSMASPGPTTCTRYGNSVTCF